VPNPDHTLVHFLTLSRFRVCEHYQPKLLACLAALDDAQLGQAAGGVGLHSIVGNIHHILEHLRRHTDWIWARWKDPQAGSIEEYFPTGSDTSAELSQVVQTTFAAWDAAVHELIAHAREHGTLPDGTPSLSAIYHLVEHLAYHLGQIVMTTIEATGEEFHFCRRGINERALNAAVEATISG